MLLKTIQNELHDIMFITMQCKIKNEVKEANFVAVIADNTSDKSNHLQNVFVLRYIAPDIIV